MKGCTQCKLGKFIIKEELGIKKCEPWLEPCQNCSLFRTCKEPCKLLTDTLFSNPRREITTMRQFSTGATRDSDDTKLDFEGFLCPLVIRRYAEYLNKHRKQADGKMRDSDNWQKGIPKTVYMKSMWRHFVDAWSCHRGTGGQHTTDTPPEEEFHEEALCAVIFNASGYLHELLKRTYVEPTPIPIITDRKLSGHCPGCGNSGVCEYNG